jgi:hypothetical protein
MTIEYPAVPAPKEDMTSMFRTVNALYQAYNALIGVPKSSDLAVLNKKNIQTYNFAGKTMGGKYGIKFSELNDTSISGETTLESALINSEGLWVNSGVGAVKSAAFLASGTGASSPSVTRQFNVDNISRTGTGTYLVTLQDKDFLGADILTNAVPVFSVRPGDTVGAEAGPRAKIAALQTISYGAGTFTFRVYGLRTAAATTGAGIVSVLEDLEVGDTIACIVIPTGY